MYVVLRCGFKCTAHRSAGNWTGESDDYEGQTPQLFAHVDCKDGSNIVLWWSETEESWRRPDVLVLVRNEKFCCAPKECMLHGFGTSGRRKLRGNLLSQVCLNNGHWTGLCGFGIRAMTIMDARLMAFLQDNLGKLAWVQWALEI